MKGKRFDVKQFLGKNSVPVLFIIICAVLIPVSGLPVNYIINEAVTRLGRNSFLILSLLIPIMAGMGLNFAMTLGAMAGEIALILVADWQIWGIPGLVLAAILSIPLSILLGLMCGSILNRAKGREMVTSYFIAYCMTGVYQLIVLYMMGPIIPILHNTLKLPRGFGIRNTVSLLQMRQSVDNALAVYVGGVKIPVLTLIVIALACLFIVWFRRTKLGQDMRAVGQDMNVARDAGINVDRTRLISIVMSTVFAGFGMIIYLQNMGNFPTYTAHTNIGMFCIGSIRKAELTVGSRLVHKGIQKFPQVFFRCIIQRGQDADGGQAAVCRRFASHLCTLGFQHLLGGQIAGTLAKAAALDKARAPFEHGGQALVFGQLHGIARQLLGAFQPYIHIRPRRAGSPCRRRRLSGCPRSFSGDRGSAMPPWCTSARSARWSGTPE